MAHDGGMERVTSSAGVARSTKETYQWCWPEQRRRSRTDQKTSCLSGDRRTTNKGEQLFKGTTKARFAFGLQ